VENLLQGMAKDKEFDKLPPQSIEAEQSVLGSLLLSKKAILKVADLLKPEDFYRDTHGFIYKTMLELFEKNEPIDVLTVSTKLEAKDLLEKVGGSSYLTTLVNFVPTASNVVHYAKIVQRKKTLRDLIEAAYSITQLSYDEQEEIEGILDQAEKSVFAVSQRSLRQFFTPIKSSLEEAFNQIDFLHKHEGGTLRGVPTGFIDLDNKLAGLQKSDYILLAARPSLGKTTLALDIVRNIAVKGKKTVGIFSLEMASSQLVDRMLCAQANIDLWKLRTGRLSDKGEDNDFTKIQQAMGELSESPIYIDDSPSATVMEIRTKARRLQSEIGLDLIVIDYIQLINPSGSYNSPVQQMTEISRSLKALARELEVPVLAVSQLSRASEQREDKRPHLSDLRDSGSLEQDADVVLLIYRKDLAYKSDNDENKNIAEIIIAKHRNGPVGEIKLFFNQDKVSFKSFEKHREE